MNQKALTHLAETLFAMQEVLKFDAQAAGTAPDANRVFGPIVAAHFSETRKALGLANAWSTKEKHIEAVMAAAAGGGLAGGPSPLMEFDAGEAQICLNCGMGGRSSDGICIYCET